MINPGLVSVSFRNLSPCEIARLAQKADLQAIEWGGDIHVPHGNIQKAREVRNLTLDHGLTIAAYGSYYIVGESEHLGLNFERVLQTALELNAPLIRVWAGSIPSDRATQDYRKNVISDTNRICELAKRENIEITFEYHANTLTDKSDSAVTLLKSIDSDNIYTLWQPAQNATIDENLGQLEAVLPWLKNIHVFHWHPDCQRHLLADGQEHWISFLKKVDTQKHTGYALLEFFKDDSIENFLDDAATLKNIIAQNSANQRIPYPF